MSESRNAAEGDRGENSLQRVPADGGAVWKVKEVAAWLKVDPCTVRRMVDGGKMPQPNRPTKRTVFWTAAQLAEWEAAGFPSCRQNAPRLRRR